MSEFAPKERPLQSCSKNCSTVNMQEKLLRTRSLLPDQNPLRVKHRYGKEDGQPGLSSVQHSTVHLENASLIKPSSPPAFGENSSQEHGMHPMAENAPDSSGKINNSHANSPLSIRFGHDFSRVKVHASQRAMPSARLLAVRPIQAKLAVSQPGDEYEREADRVAEQVMSMPKPRTISAAELGQPMHMQRFYQKYRTDRARLKDKNDEEILQTKATPGRVPEVTSDLHRFISSMQGGGSPLSNSERSFFEPRFGYNFSRVRVHSDAQAAESARAVNALAYTVGQDVVFGKGQYTPNTLAGLHLIAHELAHIAQQDATNQAAHLQISSSGDSLEHEMNGLEAAAIEGHHSTIKATTTGVAMLCREVNESPPPDTVRDRFYGIYDQFERYWVVHNERDASALIPDLRAEMTPQIALQYAVEIAFKLMSINCWAEARDILRMLEDVRGIQNLTPDIHFDYYSKLSTPLGLFTQGSDEALAGRTEQSLHSLGLAYLFAQLILHDASQRRITHLNIGRENPRHVPMNRGFSYERFSEIYGILRDILGFYPQLEREANAAGDLDRARRYSGLGYQMRTELRDSYTLRNANAYALTMEAEATTTPFGEIGYAIVGRNMTTTETVTYMPGNDTPAQLGPFPPYAPQMEEVMESIAGQEEYLTEIFAYPEIRTEFQGVLPDMNRLNDRLRVWRTMFSIYQQRNHTSPLGDLMSLIRSYQEHFTFHAEYNIRDYGVSYLSSDFPEDLAGRAVRDCGVYALMTAYEVYRTAREASPCLNLDFRLYAGPDHVVLVIADRDLGNFYIANNDQITGPHRGEEGRAVVAGYSQRRRFDLIAGLTLNLGSTDIDGEDFRNQIWNRYLVLEGRYPEPEPQTSGAEITPEVFRETWQQYHDDLTRFNQQATALNERLNWLTGTITTPSQPISDELDELTGLGSTLTSILLRRSLQANISISRSRMQEVLGRADEEMLRQILGPQPGFWAFTPEAGHPLARLAMAWLRFQSLGGRLTSEAQQLIRDLNRIPEFHTDINAYIQRRHPPQF